MASPNLDADLLKVQALSYKTLAQSGVYLLIFGDEVVYVGQSRNMYKRIGQHMAECIKMFDSVACRPCPAEDLLTLETVYMAKYSPRYNRAGMQGLRPIVRKMSGVSIDEVRLIERSAAAPIKEAPCLKNENKRKARWRNHKAA